MDEVKPKRKKTGGRKKGTPNKFNQSIAQMLIDMGHNAAVEHVFIFRECLARYAAAKKKKNQYGAASALEAARSTNSDLMKYIYPALKAVEHTGADGGPIQFKNYNDIIKALGGEIDEDGEGETT